MKLAAVLSPLTQRTLKLAREIANRLEQELKFPGEIRVHVIRDYRVIEYAR